MTFCLQMLDFTKNYIPSYSLGTTDMNDFASEVPYLYFTHVWASKAPQLSKLL